MKTIFKILTWLFIAFVGFAFVLHAYTKYIIGFDFTKINYNPTKDEIIKYAKEVDIPENCFYIIRPEFQYHEQEKGIPNATVYENFNKVAVAGTCYEEYPNILDAFINTKKKVKESDMYILNEKKLFEKIKEIDKINQIPLIDSTKKYHVFFYFPFYANHKNKKLLGNMYTRYKDSCQFFFVNIDKLEKQ